MGVIATQVQCHEIFWQHLSWHITVIPFYCNIVLLIPVLLGNSGSKIVKYFCKRNKVNTKFVLHTSSSIKART